MASLLQDAKGNTSSGRFLLIFGAIAVVFQTTLMILLFYISKALTIGAVAAIGTYLTGGLSAIGVLYLQMKNGERKDVQNT